MKILFNKVYEGMLLEMSLPKGFDQSDVITLDQFVDIEKRHGNEIDMNLEEPVSEFERQLENYETEEFDEEEFEPEISDIDIDEFRKVRLGKPSSGVDLAKRPEKLLHKSIIVDENGNMLDDAKLKAVIKKRPISLLGQNGKMKKSGIKAKQDFYQTRLPSYMGLFVDEDTDEFKVVKTCPSAGECTKFCYAAKGNFVRFSATGLSAARTVNFLMNDPIGFENQMVTEIASQERKSAKRKNTLAIRWHDSGDFLSEKYMQLAFSIAKRTPNVTHYAYTKQLPLLDKIQGDVPKNFFFRKSFGGEYDEMINPKTDNYAEVVPMELFNDLPKGKKTKFTPGAIKTLKQRVAKAFKLRPNTILTHDELLKVKPGKKKYNVLVWDGHGDDAGTRKDVLGNFLLAH